MLPITLPQSQHATPLYARRELPKTVVKPILFKLRERDALPLDAKLTLPLHTSHH